jgi:hypothetical protein
MWNYRVFKKSDEAFGLVAMPYRESMEKPTQDQINEFVTFGAPCPYCEGKIIGYRRLVRRRSWSFLWWKSHPAYYKVKCHQCKEYHKELLPKPEMF